MIFLDSPVLPNLLPTSTFFFAPFVPLFPACCCVLALGVGVVVVWWCCCCSLSITVNHGTGAHSYAFHIGNPASMRSTSVPGETSASARKLCSSAMCVYLKPVAVDAAVARPVYLRQPEPTRVELNRKGAGHPSCAPQTARLPPKKNCLHRLAGGGGGRRRRRHTVRAGRWPSRSAGGRSPSRPAAPPTKSAQEQTY